jgi:hypothetical protein
MVHFVNLSFISMEDSVEFAMMNRRYVLDVKPAQILLFIQLFFMKSALLGMEFSKTSL